MDDEEGGWWSDVDGGRTWCARGWRVWLEGGSAAQALQDGLGRAEQRETEDACMPGAHRVDRLVPMT